MIKRLLTLVAAAAAISFGASADTLPLPLDDLNGGWGDTTYDPATKTITYPDGWVGKGWWLESGGTCADYSLYDEVVIETVDNTIGYTIVIEYNAAGDNSSVAIPADRLKGVCPLDAERKDAVKQIYLQSHAAGTLTLKAAYLQNEVVVDPKEPVILWEGNKAIDWWTNAVDLTPTDFVAAKCAAGDKLILNYTATDGNGFKIVGVHKDWSNGIIPLMTKLEGFNSEHETINLPTTGEYTINLDADDAAVFVNSAEYQTFKFCGQDVTLNKITLIHDVSGGIADITVDENAPVEFFNLQGVRVANPENGLYIRRQGNKATKVFVK